MALKINPPIFSSAKDYERYKVELQAWARITDVSKAKQAIAVALSLPEEDASGIRERVFNEISMDDLAKDDGLDQLITFFDKHLGKDELEDCMEKLDDFEECRRDNGQAMGEFISKFDQQYNKVLKKGLILPPQFLAFALLKRANITREERMLVLTGMNYNMKNELYEQAKRSLLKFKGEQGSDVCKTASPAIKLEPAYSAEDEAYWSGSRRAESWRQQGRGRGSGETSRGYAGARGYGTGHRTAARGRGKSVRNVNPSGPDGHPLLCKACGSYRHMLNSCPDSWENRRDTVNLASESKMAASEDGNAKAGVTETFPKEI